jgi:hypothetical protein
MDISVGLTKGFHNFPKLWGDDTVRPQEKVSDFKSGVMAVGKEFGYGWYDGVTGLVTQPWRGAQKEGPSGFLKGVGKGLGGFATKPFAGFSGILGHTMKGVHKEMQKLFGSNVQSYIVASRVAQGYEEWLLSSDAEKQDVIIRWKLIQKYLKEKRNPDDMMLDVLKAQRKENMEDTEVSSASADAPNLGPESATLAMAGSQSPEESLEAVEVNQTIQPSVQETSRRDAEEDVDTERAIQEDVSQLQHQRQAEQENLRQAIAASETEAQRHASEALEFERQLERVMAQSLREQRQRQSSNGSSVVSLDDGDGDEDEDEYEQGSEEMAEKVTGSSSQQPPSYDPTSQREQGPRDEKTAQERTEEEIVMEYVKKQSLLEVHHRNKGKGRATAVEDEEDEDLQKALKLSMQGHESDEIPRI